MTLFPKYSFALSVTQLILLIVPSASFADLKMDASLPSPVAAQITQDLSFLKKMRGSKTSGLYQKIFATTQLDGDGLFEFFTSRVETIGSSPCGGGGSIAACVQPLLDSTTMWVTQNYATFDIPQIYRLSVLFHESRHTEVPHSNWMHATCPTPFVEEQGKDVVGILSGMKMAGMPACDVTPLGSYGLQAVFLKNIEKSCQTCSQKALLDAKLYGDDTLKRISDLQARKQLRDDLQ